MIMRHSWSVSHCSLDSIVKKHDRERVSALSRQFPFHIIRELSRFVCRLCDSFALCTVIVIPEAIFFSFHPKRPETSGK
jgi:hypothetical protein